MNKTNLIQIQPGFAERDAWLSVAEREGLFFESLELSTGYLDEPEKVQDWYRACGRTTSLHGVFMDNYPVSPDPMIREVSRRRCEQSCEEAVYIGAKHVVFHSTALPFVRGGLDDSWAKDASAYYAELAERYDLRIWIENFNDPDPGPMRKLMEHADSERLGICLDAGHANYSREPLSVWLEQLSPWIGYLHLSDNLGSWDDHLALGQGNVDFALLDRWRKTQDREMIITLEVKKISDLERSLVFLKQNKLFD